jgi:hypothetical protein
VAEGYSSLLSPSPATAQQDGAALEPVLFGASKRGLAVNESQMNVALIVTFIILGCVVFFTFGMWRGGQGGGVYVERSMSPCPTGRPCPNKGGGGDDESGDYGDE